MIISKESQKAIAVIVEIAVVRAAGKDKNYNVFIILTSINDV